MFFSEKDLQDFQSKPLIKFPQKKLVQHRKYQESLYDKFLILFILYSNNRILSISSAFQRIFPLDCWTTKALTINHPSKNSKREKQHFHPSRALKSVFPPFFALLALLFLTAQKFSSFFLSRKQEEKTWNSFAWITKVFLRWRCYWN